MPDNTPNDDLVASILLKDAEARAQRSQKEGVHAFLADPITGRLAGLSGTGSSSRPGKPKPNTRFLANIVKEVQGHNNALLRKEEEDAKRRLRGLKGLLGGNGRERKGEDTRQRDRRRDEGRTRRSRSRSPGHRKEPRRDRSNDRVRSSSRDRHRDRRRSDKEKESRRGRSRSPKRRERSTSRSAKKRHHTSQSRSRSPDSKPKRKTRRASIEPYKPRHKRARQRSPSKSPSLSRSPSPPPRSHHKSTHTKHTRERKTSESPPPKPKSKHRDSDFGPSPPPQPRGRGIPTDGSKMDDHFSESYDPTLDVDLSSDGWEDSVQAFRDRQKFKQLGGDRLRAAGFTEEQIRRWEGKEEREVKWASKSEGREWDRGKVWVEEEDGKKGSWTVKAGWKDDVTLGDY